MRVCMCLRQRAGAALPDVSVCVRVCMCMWASVCVRVCMCMWAFVCACVVHACARAHVRACVRAYTHACIHAHVDMHTLILYMHAGIKTSVHVTV